MYLFLNIFDSVLLLTLPFPIQLHQQATFHIVQLDKIVNVVEVTDKAASVDEALHVRPVDMNKLRQREATAIKKESQRASKINPNIGREVQLLFNELDRTLPCRWDGPKIVVLEDIEIVSPYTKDNVQMRSGAASARPSTSLGRVKQIVDTYYSRQRK
jgi:hypothetical protein